MAACLLALGAGCGDDQLIDLPFELRFGQPISDRRLPVDDALPPPGGMLLFAQGGTACAGAEVPLSVRIRGGTAPYAYEWTPATGLSDPTVADPFSVTDEPITYTVKVTDARGQVQQTQVSVGRHASPVATISFAQGAALTCDGGSVLLDGAGSKAADGGAVTYAWDLGLDGTPDGADATFGHTPTANVDVRLTVTDANGCTASVEQQLGFRENPTPSIAFAQGSDRVCSGDAVALDGSGSRDADGQPVSTFAWDIDGDPGTVEDADAAVGPYVAGGTAAVLTVTDAFGCSASVSQSIAVGQRPTAAIAFTSGGPFVCDGTSVALDGSGSADFTGAPVAAYAWEFDGSAGVDGRNATTGAFVPHGSRPVRLVVTDAWGCTDDAAIDLEVRGLPTAAISFAQGSANACEGSEVTLTGAASEDADGNAVASYGWDLDGDGAVDRSGIESGSFVPASPRQVARLVVTDLLGCSASTVQLLEPRGLPQPVIDFTQGDETLCAGEQVNLTGARSRDANGNLITSFAWDLDGIPATAEVNGVATGAFTPDGHDAVLRVTDALGCSATATQAIGVGTRPTAVIRFTAGSAAICSGDTVAFDGSASTTAAGGPVASYAWDLDGDAATTESTAVQPPAVAPTGDLTVRLTVTDGQGCTGQAVQLVDARALPQALIAFAQGSANACSGTTTSLTGTSSRDADGNAVTTYAWDLDGNGSVDESSAATSSFSSTTSRTVRLTVTDAIGCVGTSTQAIAPRALPRPVIDFTLGDSSMCAGQQVAMTGTRSTDASGNPVAGYAWDWDGNRSTTESNAASTSPFSPTGSDVVLTVTDAQGCSASATQAVGVGARPTAVIGFLAGGANVCSGDLVTLDGSGSTTASGGAVASYAWDLDGVGSTTESTAAQPSIRPTADVGVRLTVTDAQGCSGEAVQLVDARSLPQAVIGFAQGSANACDGTITSLTGSGSRDESGNSVASYAWDLDGNGTTDQTGTTTTAFPLDAPRTARLTVTDVAGCVGTATQALAPRGLPTVDIQFLAGSPLICGGGSLQLGGGGSRDADGNPVAAYAWDLTSDGTVDQTGADTTVFSPAGAATASLRVTDAQGCSAAGSRVYDVRANPTPRIAFTSGAAATCSGTTVELNGGASRDGNGNPVASYAWDLDGDGAADGSAASTGAFVPGGNATAVLTVTDDVGCSASLSQALTVRPLPVVDAGADTSLCGGSTVQLGAAPTSGLAYAWSPATGLSDPSASNPVLTAVSTTTYRLTATDTFGCSSSDEVSIGVHPLPVADAGPDRAVARTGSVQLLGGASGGTPGYGYAWTPASSLSDPAVPQPMATPSNDTSYMLQVTDSMGCTDTDQMQVSVVPGLTVDAGQDSLFCANGGSPLTISGSTAGGVAPLTYRWTANPACSGCIASPTSSTTAVTPTQDTVFTLQVTDANGYTSSDSVAVDFRPSISVNAGPDRQVARGDATQIGESPAQPGLLYAWTCDNWSCGLSDANVSNPWVAPEGTTAYKVTLSDGKTCTATDTVVVSVEVRVVATVPTEAHDPWPRDAMVWIIFDGDIDPVSLAGNVSMWDPYTGAQIRIANMSYDSPSRTLEIDPDENTYSRNNRPAIVVLRGGPTGIRTSGASPMSLYNDFFLSFNVSSMGDGAAPRSRFLQPIAGALQVPVTTDVVLGFDEPVEPRSVTTATFRVGNVPATVGYDPRNWTATLRPSEPLLPNTLYTVTVNGVKDGSGNRSNWTWSFTTGASSDVTPPVVSFSDPANNVLDYDVAQPLSVTFSEAIDTVTLSGVRLLDTSTGLPVSGEVSYDETTHTAILDPHRMLEPRRSYRFEISGIRDQAGNLMTSRYSAAFTTASVFLLERFEATASGWSLTNPWAVHSQGAVWGSYGLADSPSGNYAANASGSATSPLISLSGRSSVSLTFWNRRAFANNNNNDRGVVEYSTNGSAWNTAGSVADVSGWRPETFSIPTGGASQLWLRLRTTSDASIQMDGWFVDEIVVR